MIKFVNSFASLQFVNCRLFTTSQRAQSCCFNIQRAIDHFKLCAKMSRDQARQHESFPVYYDQMLFALNEATHLQTTPKIIKLAARIQKFVLYYLNHQEIANITTLLSTIYTKPTAITLLDNSQLLVAIQGLQDLTNTALLHQLLLQLNTTISQTQLQHILATINSNHILKLSVFENRLLMTHLNTITKNAFHQKETNFLFIYQLSKFFQGYYKADYIQQTKELYSQMQNFKVKAGETIDPVVFVDFYQINQGRTISAGIMESYLDYACNNSIDIGMALWIYKGCVDNCLLGTSQFSLFLSSVMPLWESVSDVRMIQAKLEMDVSLNIISQRNDVWSFEQLLALKDLQTLILYLQNRSISFSEQDSILQILKSVDDQLVVKLELLNLVYQKNKPQNHDQLMQTLLQIQATLQTQPTDVLYKYYIILSQLISKHKVELITTIKNQITQLISKQIDTFIEKEQEDKLLFLVVTIKFIKGNLTNAQEKQISKNYTSMIRRNTKKLSIYCLVQINRLLNSIEPAKQIKILTHLEGFFDLYFDIQHKALHQFIDQNKNEFNNNLSLYCNYVQSISQLQNLLPNVDHLLKQYNQTNLYQIFECIENDITKKLVSNLESYQISESETDPFYTEALEQSTRQKWRKEPKPKPTIIEGSPQLFRLMNELCKSFIQANKGSGLIFYSQTLLIQQQFKNLSVAEKAEALYYTALLEKTNFIEEQAKVDEILKEISSVGEAKRVKIYLQLLFFSLISFNQPPNIMDQLVKGFNESVQQTGKINNDDEVIKIWPFIRKLL